MIGLFLFPLYRYVLVFFFFCDFKETAHELKIRMVNKCSVINNQKKKIRDETTNQSKFQFFSFCSIFFRVCMYVCIQREITDITNMISFVLCVFFSSFCLLSFCYVLRFGTVVFTFCFLELGEKSTTITYRLLRCVILICFVMFSQLFSFFVRFR